MLEDPGIFGGVHRVIQVWKTQARRFLEDIVRAVDAHPM
jgi:hypothetical protein